MPIFTTIGLAIGASAASALAVGVGATALATAVGIGAYALGGGFDSKRASADARIEAATGTGALTADESQTIAKKKAYRAGIINTSPGGLDSEPNTSTQKLK